jgi:hypothetical protein
VRRHRGLMRVNGPYAARAQEILSLALRRTFGEPNPPCA